MEDYIKISTLNDFMYCPRTIYYHNLYDNYDKKIYQQEAQIAWTLAHKSVDEATYSTSKYVLQGIPVYSERYGLAGKIDQFFMKEGRLVERKNMIKMAHVWYRYQLWAQMFCLEEMWYDVSKLELYSMKDNKKYKVYKPSSKQLLEFEEMLEKYRSYDLFWEDLEHNMMRCHHSIYHELCDYCLWEIYPQLSLFDDKI